MAEWVQVVCEVSTAEVDAVSGLLWAAGVAGIEEQPAGEGCVRLVAGMDAALAADVVHALEGRGHAVSVVDVAADAGLDGWREFAQPVRVGSLAVWPEWLDASGASDDVTVIRLDAGRSFGHGAHVTTRVALELVQRVVRSGDRVLDLGCGSGVLALAAAALGAVAVTAVDIAPEAVDATTHNVALNGLGDVVTVVLGSLDDVVVGDGFDVVVANIEAPFLVDLAPGIAAATGRVVVSGFIDEQEARVRGALGRLEVVDRLELDGWVGLELQAPTGQI